MKRYIYYIFLLLITWSCEDYYVPELEKYPDALVVDGILTDQSDYTTIRLTRSANFDEPSSFVGEKGAIVTIESDNGESYSTKEISRGFYQTVDQIKTSVGVGYWLKIITSDGTEYRSNVEKMPSPNPVDSIYLTDTVFRDVFTMGARPVASMNSIRFASIEGNSETAKKHRYLLKGVVAGIGYRDWETDRKSTRLNSSHRSLSRMPSSA